MRRTMIISLSAILLVAVVALFASVASGSSPRLGLDLQGGASVVLSPTGTYSGAPSVAIPMMTRSVVARRACSRPTPSSEKFLETASYAASQSTVPSGRIGATLSGL